MSKIKRVYVAGLLTPRGVWSKNLAIDYLANIRHMTKSAIKVLLCGFDPFCPALDYLFFLELEDGQVITEPMIKRYSKSWLEVCDAVMLTPGWKKSDGTLSEIELAKQKGIPVFETIDDLIAHNNTLGE